MTGDHSVEPSQRTTSAPASPAHWFLRGAMLGVLVCAAANAGSYFARSTNWGILFGPRAEGVERIGFPWLMWEEGDTYDGMFVDVWPFVANIAVGLCVGGLFGGCAVACRRSLDAFEQRVMASLPPRPEHRFQLSLRGLLFVMALAAVIAAAGRYALRGQWEVLALVYVAGPWLLVTIAFVPLGLSWQQRVVLIVPATLLLMLAAVAVGQRLHPPIEFDKVLLGVFVCWTPQAIAVSLAIGVAVAVKYRRRG